MPFQDAYGGGLSYVDVPTPDLQKYEGKSGVSRGNEFMLPPELAAKAKPVIPAPAPQPAAEQAEERVVVVDVDIGRGKTGTAKSGPARFMTRNVDELQKLRNAALDSLNSVPISEWPQGQTKEQIVSDIVGKVLSQIGTSGTTDVSDVKLPGNITVRLRTERAAALGVSEKTSLADRIRAKKVKDPNMYDATLGIPILAWNGLVETAALLVEAGMSVQAAISKVIGDYKAKHPSSPIDEIRVAVELTRQITPIERVAGENTFAKRAAASQDLDPRVKDLLTQKLYRVLKNKDAQAGVDEIMRTVPSIDSAITLFNDAHRQLPEWVRGLLAGGIISEFTKQERAAEAAGDQALAEQLRTQSANFIDHFSTYASADVY
jgi:hypothetical protein